jgi:hypothetical protein
MMESNLLIIVFVLLFIVSVLFNVAMFLYSRQVLLKIYKASEEASDIFTQLDTFHEHIQSVHEMPVFYGDETLQGLLDHSKELLEFLAKYEEVYSFVQPDLIEQLAQATEDMETADGQETTT